MALAGLIRMTFAPGRWANRRFPPLLHTLPVMARLLATALLAVLARPIPACRLPARPKPRRFDAGFATVPIPRMMGVEPLLAPLQETDPRAEMNGALPPRRRAIMLDKDQGSANSPRSSPGSGASTPLRDAFDWSPPGERPPSSLITPPAAFHLLLPCRWLAPMSPRLQRARFGPLIPRNWPPVSPRLTLRPTRRN